MWTEFMDMHSGGRQKEDFSHCFIEAPCEEAKIIFYNMFGHSPERVTCTCCGEDYSISECETLDEATAYERGCDSGYIDTKGREVPQEKAWESGKGMKKGCKFIYFERPCTKYSFHKYITLSDYLKDKSVRVIYTADILPEQRIGEVPTEGYVWI
jgi:hypothetical protein